jgi:spoIIIJ-associated protein
VKEIELNGKTVDEAKQAALDQLGVTEDRVEIIVIKKGRPGVLGVGAEEARIKVHLLDDLSKSGDIKSEAQEILGELIKYLGLEATIHVSNEFEEPITLNIEGDDLGVLIGRHGQALASLQYILRLIIAEKFKNWIPINIDVAGYKKRRYESLQNLALRLAEQVKTSKRSINLEPMPSDERRIIHLTLTDHPDVVTQSIGLGDERKVVIQLRKR